MTEYYVLTLWKECVHAYVYVLNPIKGEVLKHNSDSPASTLTRAVPNNSKFRFSGGVP